MTEVRLYFFCAMVLSAVGLILILGWKATTYHVLGVVFCTVAAVAQVLGVRGLWIQICREDDR